MARPDERARRAAGPRQRFARPRHELVVVGGLDEVRMPPQQLRVLGAHFLKPFDRARVRTVELERAKRRVDRQQPRDAARVVQRPAVCKRPVVVRPVRRVRAAASAMTRRRRRRIHGSRPRDAGRTSPGSSSAARRRRSSASRARAPHSRRVAPTFPLSRAGPRRRDTTSESRTIHEAGSHLDTPRGTRRNQRTASFKVNAAAQRPAATSAKHGEARLPHRVGLDGDGAGRLHGRSR